MANEENNAIEKGYKYFIEKVDGFFCLFIRCNDCCGNSYSGDFDYHWSYRKYSDAKKDAILLTQN